MKHLFLQKPLGAFDLNPFFHRRLPRTTEWGRLEVALKNCVVLHLCSYLDQVAHGPAQFHKKLHSLAGKPVLVFDQLDSH